MQGLSSRGLTDRIPSTRQKVKIELDRMLEAGIIEPFEESEWIIPMVVQDKLEFV
jgi:hypothetical protein